MAVSYVNRGKPMYIPHMLNVLVLLKQMDTLVQQPLHLRGLNENHNAETVIKVSIKSGNVSGTLLSSSDFHPPRI
jgi:hypothetical protein